MCRTMKLVNQARAAINAIITSTAGLALQFKALVGIVRRRRLGTRLGTSYVAGFNETEEVT